MGEKILKFLKSMPFSFILLGIIVAECIAGSTGYHKIYTSVWLLIPAALLCLNLVLCSISRFPSTFRRWKAAGPGHMGMWGSWVTHLGLLLIIVSFALGQFTAKETTAYGIAGSTQPLGDTGLTLTIDSFEVRLREDFTVDQYIAGLSVEDGDGNRKSGTTSVNNPFSAFGYGFYQDSMGWAAYVDVIKDDMLLTQDLICTGEYTTVGNTGIAIFFNKFYPDFAENSDGSFCSVTPLPNNPRCLYSIYVNGRLMTMGLTEPGQPADLGVCSFIMRDPTEYTLIVAKKDPTAVPVGISSAVLLAGLVISFYVRPWEDERRKRNVERTADDN